MTMQFYISVPLSRLEESLQFVSDNGFQPEIRMTLVDHMMSLREDDLARLREMMEARSLRPFTHGPFFGLDVASLDRNISEYSVRSMMHGLEATRMLGGSLMVIHTGYLPQFSRGGRRHWFRNWAERMPQILEKADEEGVVLALENTWDDRPEVLLHLAGMIPGSKTAFCLDTGHVNAFSRIPPGRWLEALGGRIAAVHLHDNDGLSDDHLAAGKGIFPFGELAAFLKGMERKPLLDIETDFSRALESREYLEKVLGG